MAHEKLLFSPLKIKGVEFKNRVWVSPMCQYSSQNGHPTDWHFVHLGSRAVGGAGLVMIEATAVTPEGRISPDDSGIWADEHILGFNRINNFIKEQGAVTGIQLAHAGRKGSTPAPWLHTNVLPDPARGWQTVAPSPIPFNAGGAVPREMNHDDIAQVICDFERATERSVKAGFQVLELHMAHGYLMHEFLSPISNRRQDEYGGSLENRMRFPLEVAHAVRRKWPSDLPLFARISATDWADGADELNASPQSASNGLSWNLNDSIVFCNRLKELGIDLIDCSSGGTLPHAAIPTGPGYQVPFAETIRRELNMMTAAVGMITDPEQAETILIEQQADAIFMARELLRNPYWPALAARSMGINIDRPNQYMRS